MVSPAQGHEEHTAGVVWSVLRHELVASAAQENIVKRTEAQILLGIHLAELGIETIAEYRFDTERLFRFDLADPERKLGFEVDGGMFRGGHKRGVALEADYAKQNLAQLQGWKILRFTNREVLTGKAKDFLKARLCNS